jgi:hypothetical protein
MIFSVVTSCIKIDDRLHRTARSVLVQSALKKSANTLQYIIVSCDVSEEGRQQLESYRSLGVKCVQEPDESMYDGLAKGLAMVKGDIVSYLNAGDVYHPEAFAILEEVFALKETQWVTGYSALCNSSCQIIGTWKPARFDRNLFSCGAYCSRRPRQPWVQQESTFWSRQLNSEIDFETLKRFRLAGDHFLWLTFSQSAELYSVHGILGAFLLHVDQLSANREAYFQEIAPYLNKPSLAQFLQMAIDFRCPWSLKYRIEKFILKRKPLEIHFNIPKNRWEYK